MGDSRPPNNSDMHDLTSLLTSIIGNGQLLARRLERGGPIDRDAFRTTVQAIEQAAWRAQEEVGRLRQRSPMEPPSTNGADH